MYSIEWLRRECARKKSFKYLFFWGHRPSPSGEITASCLSQWWASKFVIDGVTYATAEHWMMASKARLFGDDEMAPRIVAASHPDQAKKLGRQVRGFDEEVWKEHRFRLVTEGNVAKFSQNAELKRFLLGTGERVLVEASPRDRIWGIGMGAKNEQVHNPENWRGLNLLGFALMETRDQLR
ncbi:MAG: NADAR family protein [Arachnia propionica]|uniref:NADAR family protein n=1 Tax=Arachnia propionica TaxID=1750 RepID=UPI0026FE6B62|nr:NADAR family protein [Arachnia propionica]